MNRSILVLVSSIIFFSCGSDLKENDEFNQGLPIVYNFTKEFKDYWNAGKAELSSYELSKSRYGEIHSGDAVLIFVTEPFLPDEQVKFDGFETSEKSERVLKLIKTEKFFTGIYPYAIMTSTFHPLSINREGLFKVNMSSQDWCGQVFTQLNNRDNKLELQKFSYFQKEGDIKKKLEKGLLEEELFSQIRIDPSKLPTGKFEIYPSSKYTRLMNKEFKKYNANGKLDTSGNNNETHKYKLDYLELDRKLEIEFESAFPYKITSWQETYTGLAGKKLTTSAKLKNTIHIAYWNHNSIADSTYRKLLGL